MEQDMPGGIQRPNVSRTGSDFGGLIASTADASTLPYNLHNEEFDSETNIKPEKEWEGKSNLLSIYGPSSYSDNKMSENDRSVMMDIEWEKRLMGHSMPIPFYPDTTRVKLEPPDHYPNDNTSLGNNLVTADPFMAKSMGKGSFDQTEVQRSVNDVVKLHRESTKTGGVAFPKKMKTANASNTAVKKARKCPVCNRAFSVRILLNRHIKSHSRKLRSSKSKSTHRLSSKGNGNSKRHLTSSSGQGKRKCLSSVRNLFRNQYLKNQIKSRMGVSLSNASCFVCQRWFSYKAVYKLHMLKTHTTSDDKLNVYMDSFASPAMPLKNHIVTPALYSQSPGGSRATKEKKYKCPLCDKSFTQSGKLSSHKKKHTGEKPYHCSVCGKDFALKDHLNIHIKIHTGEKPYPCTLCDKAFRQGGHLRMHMQTHTGIKPHRCEFCDKAFSQKGSLMSHMRTHTGEKLSHQCTMCDKSFRDSTKLNNHVRTHTGEKPFQCSLCDRAFSQSGDLVRHMRTHTGEKPYVCNVCNKQFSEGSNLNKHMRTHTGYKPHECSICHRSFSEGSTLKNHMRIHSGEKPYQCSVCQKEFIQSGDLYKHMRTHTGEKPHSCHLCGRAFTESSTLRKHMKTHRSEEEKDNANDDDGGRRKGVGNKGARGSLDPKSINFDNAVTQQQHFGIHNAGGYHLYDNTGDDNQFQDVNSEGMDIPQQNMNINLGTPLVPQAVGFRPSVNYNIAQSQNVNLELQQNVNYGHQNVNFNSTYSPEDICFDTFKPLNGEEMEEDH